VGNILTPDGKHCESAVSPFRNMLYRPNLTYTSELNTNTSYDCGQGLHFYPTEEILKSHVQDNHYLIETKNKLGTVIGKQCVNRTDNI
jgi:hypothetical protein